MTTDPPDQPPSNPLTDAAHAAQSTDAGRPDADSDRPLWSGRASYKAMLGHWLGFALGLLIIVLLLMSLSSEEHPKFSTILLWVAWIIILVPAAWLAWRTLYLRWGVGYRLTEQRLFIDRGLIGRTIDQLELIRVDDIRVRQGPIQRLLGIGNVIIISTDATDSDIVIRGIVEPEAVAEHVRTRMRALRGRGLYVESL